MTMPPGYIPGDFVMGLVRGHQASGVVHGGGVYVSSINGECHNERVSFSEFAGMRHTDIYEMTRWEHSFREAVKY